MDEAKKNKEGEKKMSEEEGFAQGQPSSAEQPQERLGRWGPYKPYLSAFVEGERGGADSDMVRKLMRDGSFSWMSLLVGPLYGIAIP